MNYLTIGQLNIPVAWLAFFIAFIYSDFRGRKSDGYTNKTIEAGVLSLRVKNYD